MTAEIAARKSPTTGVTTWHWLLIAASIVALHRLVHAVAHTARLPVLRRRVPRVPPPRLARPPDPRHAGGRRLGTGREFELDHRPLPRRHDLAGLFRRYHRQFDL